MLLFCKVFSASEFLLKFISSYYAYYNYCKARNFEFKLNYNLLVIFNVPILGQFLQQKPIFILSETGGFTDIVSWQKNQ